MSVAPISLLFDWVTVGRRGIINSGLQSTIFFVGGVCVQSIEHPGCVWDVAFLPNGDLVTACSDGVARVWTREKKLYAPTEEMEAFLSLISSRKSAALVSFLFFISCIS